ncbi:D-2-hydroxyacid dehydrogenase [Mobilitalea sibirica]|uniref:D-2-hydroxyacid dehydrogenase n=2 Tax=Mobilitalea sibirica TaxID=1462919 RepID=A0A8J7HCB2_9FIRM|nr:D-2-hydroxyacid dehydrogenase [Mobilitalea sibirica]
MTNSIFPMKEEYKRMIENTTSMISLNVRKHDEVTMEMVQKAEIIFGWPSKEQLREAKNLKWLHLPSAGADRFVDKESYCNKEIVLTNSSGVFGLPIAEHVFAMILSYNRKLQEYAYQKAERKWQGVSGERDFYGSTIGIIGMGDIGTEVAKRAKVWGANVLGIKRTITETPEYVDRIYSTEEIDKVLAESDYIVLALPSTPKTQEIISEEKLKIMKSDAFIINVGRGSLINQEALIKALKEGWIGGAGIDVTTPEPLPEDNPLWELPNVIITPHSSGGSPSNDKRRMNIFLDNLNRYLKHQPLRNTVDFREGY